MDKQQLELDRQQLESMSFYEKLKYSLEAGVEYKKGKRTLRVTRLALPPPPKKFAAADIQALRRKLHMSQEAFATLLQVTNRTVQLWEDGHRVPTRSSARLLQFVEQPELLQAAVGQAPAPPPSS